ncbi:hypothetical protein C7121_17995 [Paenibacillus glucanolyticus]|nr:hypothetical protein A3958_25015 [Paenibacillus glucanolyticus]AVV57879.1 hypothetical protein C7121_17995 [Paenibacillus glucanolyticus]ETT34668.1 hypothetical protein C169_19959 [Paenibacillus sp. FSL R5-808]OMF83352.1 hypothetical protein BK142_01545 [Paenibacillus glucanolyticus]
MQQPLLIHIRCKQVAAGTIIYPTKYSDSNKTALKLRGSKGRMKRNIFQFTVLVCPEAEYNVRAYLYESCFVPFNQG